MTVTVTKVSPLGQQINRFTPVIFDVASTGKLAYVNIFNTLGNQKNLVSKLKNGFESGYANNSTETEVVADQSYRYSILPDRGWLGNPQVTFDVDEIPLQNWDSLQLPYNASVKSLLSDGSNRLVWLRPDIADFNFEYNDAFSVLLWFKTNTSSNSMPVNKRQAGGLIRGWDFLFYTGSQIEFYRLSDGSNKSGVRITPTYADNNWHQIIAVNGSTGDASNMNLFFDGTEPSKSYPDNSLVTNTMVYPEAPMCIGARSGVRPDTSADFNFVGNIGDVAIYDKKLTLAEATTLYNSGKYSNLLETGPFVNLIGWWRVGDDPLPFSWDWSGNGKHAEMWNISDAQLDADVP